MNCEQVLKSLINIAKEMGLKEREKVVLAYDKRRKRIIIKDWR